MSDINCSACDTLRTLSPSFVQNGVTSTIAASLKNNTGINPGLTVVHDNCEDLQTILDCLIGRMGDEVKAYDVCDWKQFMAKFIPNLYETLKADIMNECGQWAKIERLCDSIDGIFDIIGTSSTGHPNWMTKTETFGQKFTQTDSQYPSDDVYPILRASILDGYGCDASRRLGVWRTGIGSQSPFVAPHTHGWRATDLAQGDELGYIRKEDVVPTYMTEARWNATMRTGSIRDWIALSNMTYVRVKLAGYIVIDGHEYNTSYKERYGENVMVMSIAGFIGDLRSGSVYNIDQNRSYWA